MCQAFIVVRSEKFVVPVSNDGSYDMWRCGCIDVTLFCYVSVTLSFAYFVCDFCAIENDSNT